MKAITLIIPDAELNKFGKSKNLSLFISKASKKKSTTDYLEELSHYLQQPQLAQASIAELTALYDGFSIQNGVWLRADPVELKADLAAVYMFGNQHLQLTNSQIKTVKNKIQPLLTDYKMQLYTTDKKRWYIQCVEDINLSSVNHETIIGKDIINFLPKSNGNINWQRLQMELQMMLHQLPDNASVNSLWFWGAGDKLSNISLMGNYKFFSNEPISGGVAVHYKIPLDELPQSLDVDTFWQNLIEGENLLVYDKLSFARSSEEVIKYQQQLDQQFIKPLLTGLKNNKIDKITVNFLSGTQYQFKKMNFYYFWRSEDRKQRTEDRKKK